MLGMELEEEMGLMACGKPCLPVWLALGSRAPVSKWTGVRCRGSKLVLGRELDVSCWSLEGEVIRREISFCSIEGEVIPLEEGWELDVFGWTLEGKEIRHNISFCSSEGEVIPLVGVEASECSMEKEEDPLGLLAGGRRRSGLAHVASGEVACQVAYRWGRRVRQVASRSEARRALMTGRMGRSSEGSMVGSSSESCDGQRQRSSLWKTR